MIYFNKKPLTGFTLIELLIVVFLIGFLVTISTVYYTDSLRRNRDNLRKSQLNIIADALDKYYTDNRSYPVSSIPVCGANVIILADWAASQNCAQISQSDPYITGNFVGHYLQNLPHDPSFDRTSNRGYMYKSDGNVYKIWAYKTVESETVAVGDPYYDQGQFTSLSLADKTSTYQISTPCQVRNSDGTLNTSCSVNY